MKLANKKFEQRFRYIEVKLREQGKGFNDTDLAEMDNYWDEAKKFGL